MTEPISDEELAVARSVNWIGSTTPALIARLDAANQEIERLRGAIWKFVNCHAHSCPRCTPTAIAALEPGND